MRIPPLALPGVLLLCAGCLSLPALGQDASKVINEYVKAEGGGGKLSRTRTVSLQGTLTRASDGKTGTFTLDTKFPNRYYLELVVGEQPAILAYNGKSAWQMTADGTASTLLEQDAQEMEALAQIANTHLLDLRKNKIGAALINAPNGSNNRDWAEVELTMPTGVKHQLYFDSRAHLLRKETAKVGGAPLEISYDDYRPEGSVPVAHRLQLRRGNDVYDILISQVIVNGTIGERVFDFPRKSQVQLPDLKQLFTQIDANQKVADKLRENYTGRRSEEETQYDNTGKVKKAEKSEYTFFYLDGDDISTLVAKDGKLLSETEQAKENEKTKKRIEEVQKEQAKKDKKDEKAKEEGKEEKDEDEPGIEVFLRACQFVNPRRERFRGQDVLVFDFEGNPEYKAKKLAEKVVQQLAGVVWVDEKHLEVVRLEAYFAKDFRFGGGLVANLQKGSGFVFEQTFLNDEVWLPTYEEAHVGARVLLVKGFKMNEVTRYWDYQRFHVETLATVSRPKGADAAADAKPSDAQSQAPAPQDPKPPPQ